MICCETEREFFDYRNAPWHLFNREFDSYNWEAEFLDMNADNAADHFTRLITKTVNKTK